MRMRWTAGIAAGAVWIGLLESILILARSGDSPTGDVLWLGLGSIGINLIVLAPVWGAIGLVPERTSSRIAIPFDSRIATKIAGLFLLACAAAGHVVNSFVLVRLYASFHVILSAIDLILATLGCLWLIPAQQLFAEKRRQFLILAAAVAVVPVLAVVLVIQTPGLRALAMERTTSLSQLVLVTSSFSGPAELTSLVQPTASASSSSTPPKVTMQSAQAPSGWLRATNILWITVDAMRFDRLPGEEKAIALPTIAELVSRGLTFRRAYAPSCWTVHSMAAMLTSRLPSQLRFDMVSVTEDWEFQVVASDSPLLGAPGRSNAFTPAPIYDASPTLAGFLRSSGYETATVIPYALYLPKAGITREFERIDDADFRRLGIDGMGTSSVPMADRAADFLRRRDRTRPFLLWLHFMEPHAPYAAWDEDSKGGSDEARYDSELRHVDRELGRVMSSLRAQDLVDETLVMVHGDHGEEFRDHGGQFHGTSVYEEQVRVPWVIAPPKHAEVKVPRAVDTAVSLLDWAPTVLDLTGSRSEAPMMGRSLASALLGGSVEARPVFVECARFGRSRRALIRWPHKLIVDPAVGTAELYDLAADPGERRNVLSDHTQVANELLGLLMNVPR